MTRAEQTLRRRFRTVYRPLVDRFFSGLAGLGLSKRELHAVPSLFLPTCGANYAQSLVKVAVVGEATLCWGDGLDLDLSAYRSGQYDPESGFACFQESGPASWRNRFWQYHAGVLGAIYRRHNALDASNPIFSSIAWGNSCAIEPHRASGSSVDLKGISYEHHKAIADLADECGLSSFENLIRAFEPNVIIYTCRNSYGSDRVLPKLDRPWQTTRLQRGWVINSGRTGSTWIFQTQHPSWIGRQGVDDRTFGAEMASAMLSRGCFAPLGKTKFYGTSTDRPLDVFASMLNSEADRILRESPGIGNLELSHRLILALAWELNRQQASMPAAVMVQLLNRIDKFKKDRWLYSPEGRGPCSVARGAWNRFNGAGEGANADAIADAFTRLNGNFAWAR